MTARPPVDALRLTPREVEVLLLLAAGFSLGEAARALGRSREAIKRRAASARDKLGARTSAQAVAMAWRAGTIT